MDDTEYTTRDFLKMAAGVLAGLIPGCKIRQVVRRTKIEPIEAIAKEESLREKWEKVINLEGVPLTSEFLNKYAKFLERESLDGLLVGKPLGGVNRRIYEEVGRGWDLFNNNAIPENYNPLVFIKLVTTVTGLNGLLMPGEISEIFGLNEEHSLYKDLRINFNRYTNDEKARIMLNYALLMVHQKLEPVVSLEVEPNAILENLRNGKGDCIEYSYATMGVYLGFCDLLRRNDLKKRVRAVVGPMINEYNSLDVMHCWIDLFYEKRWKSYETVSSDKTGNGDLDPNSNVLVELKEIEAKHKLCIVPLISTEVTKKGIQHRIHVLPRD